MESGNGFGYGAAPENSDTSPLYHDRPTPPLSAIDRFLRGQSQSQNPLSHQIKEIFVSGNGFSEFSSNSSTHNHENGGEIIWQNLPTPNGIFMDGIETRYWDMNPNMALKQAEAKSVPKRKRTKGGYPSNLIKGQWTDEEDRKLIKLVKQYGVRKWAQIAEKMLGRAGKQCRERWHNHLRPDIKKDTWSEEEERMLIEAHQNIGNKWAEIAKQIPGRSENSIKNHWNATKRRQNSSRKSKKSEGKTGKSQPSPLQDYIRRKILDEKNKSAAFATTISATTLTNSTISDDPSIKLDVFFPQSPSDDSTSLIAQTYADELNFMQQLFATNPKAPLIDDGKLLANSTSEINTYIENVPKEVAPDNMPPDHCISFLLDGATFLPPTDYGYNDLHMDFGQMNEASSSGTKDMDFVELISAPSGTKDMDLIEMISASRFA